MESEDGKRCNHDQWESVASIMRKNGKHVREFLTDDIMRARIQFFSVFCIFGVVSFVMTVVNIMTGWWTLMLSTLFFGVVNIINLIFCLTSKRMELAARNVFGCECIALFTFFVVVGEPEGFSAIWMALLPICGLILYQMKKGTILVLTQLAILLFLFWTPLGRSLLCYTYTDSFMLRFPFLYMACFACGAFFEYVRYMTHGELVKARGRYAYMYSHDALTGLYNRYGFNRYMNELMHSNNETGFAFAIADLDHFKNINDTYGHQNGDVVLRSVGEEIRTLVGGDGIVSRWGGEEFAILIHNIDYANELCNKILEVQREKRYDFDGEFVRVTISIGLIEVPAGKMPELSAIITPADKNLYVSKSNGRNQLTRSRL